MPPTSKVRARLLLASKVAGSVKDRLYWSSSHLPVDLRWEEEGDSTADFYLDQSGWYEGELRLYRGESSGGELVWSGDVDGLRRAIKDHVARFREAREQERVSRAALAERLRAIEQVAKEALHDLDLHVTEGAEPSGREPVRTKLESVVAELERVGDDLDDASEE